MNKEVEQLINQEKESLAAAQLLNSSGFHGFAVSRAYYSILYIAEAFLLGKQMVFSSHIGYFVKSIRKIKAVLRKGA